MRKRLLSGMRPTGPLHLGHLVGALDSWVKLKEEFECFYMVADWHALMSEYENPKNLEKNGKMSEAVHVEYKRLDRETVSDSELVRRFKMGDEKAFSFIVLKYQKRLLNTARVILGDEDEAMDISQAFHRGRSLCWRSSTEDVHSILSDKGRGRDTECAEAH